ncbi:extensin family protein [Sphingomonas morindae]|uniref:Extensin family protein n=1 Tax=Sphingomonas morindae TaxID=1541170 RepID=A0ABY4X572_9SPHN|nr:extensin family protein [Sphingomonas morindae]USI72037.1 extensin family protein [Sphingomonas morindae]
MPQAAPPPRRGPASIAQPAPARPAYDAAAHRQCLASLAADGARFESLPDRVYTSQCSALGAVRLLDIGMPVTNLGQMTCPLADALTRWTRDATQKAALAWLSAPVVRIESFGTYSCRPINNVAGARLSEHGLSNAVDIAGFVLANGRRITVLDDWNGPDAYARNFLRAVHDAGCRRFQVVLGPDANALHRNHFHFDMGPGRACR